MKHALQREEGAIDETGESIFGKKHPQRHIRRTWLPHTGDLDDPGMDPKLNEEEFEDENSR